MQTDETINLLNLSATAMERFVVELGEPKYRAQQLIQWIHHRGVTDFDAMSNLSKTFREKLHEVAIVKPLEVAFERASQDGTYKWLFRLEDGNAIETVYIPEKNRGTLCVSSQVGCGLNCSFCSTGKQGFNRNLTLAEIIGQLWGAVRTLAPEGLDKNHAITNVVFMGMGEPLLNYDIVLAAIDYMLSDLAYGLSKYRVTLSTSGLIPAMQQLKQDTPTALAVSLHAPNNELRNQLVPLNKKYPLEQLIPACREYFAGQPKRQVTFEYVMLDGVNDKIEHARQLVKLLKGVPCKVNLIPFNPFPGTRYTTSAPERVSAFQNTLMKAGVATWVRKTRGDDIEAACGQLAGKFKDRTGRHDRWLRTGSVTTIPVEIPIKVMHRAD